MPTHEEMENNQFNPVGAVKISSRSLLAKAVRFRDGLRTMEDLQRLRKNKTLGNIIVI